MSCWALPQNREGKYKNQSIRKKKAVKGETLTSMTVFFYGRICKFSEAMKEEADEQKLTLRQCFHSFLILYSAVNILTLW